MAVAEANISALGEAHNQQVLYSDLRPLLREDFPTEPDAVSLLAAALRCDSSGCPDAIARIGGPFVRFLEFTTPEEASQQLGRIIVGASRLLNTPYDLQVHWTLERGGTTQTHTTQIEGAAGPHILNAPFAWEGQVAAMRWTAEVLITWQGRTLRQMHHSNVLFPSIYVWHGVVYDRHKSPLFPEQVVDAKGRISGRLEWQSLHSAAGWFDQRQPTPRAGLPGDALGATEGWRTPGCIPGNYGHLPR